MTIIQSGQSIPLSLSAGQSLVVKDMSGTSSVAGSVTREDAQSRIGQGFFVYGPVTSAATVTLTTTGVTDYQIVNGDPTPANQQLLYDPGSPPTSGPTLTGDGAGAVQRALNAIVPWDTTSAELQRAHNAALSENRILNLGNATYNITDPVTFQATAVSIDAREAVINCANMNAAYALRLDSKSADGYKAKRQMILGLTLVGPGKAANTGALLVSGSSGSRGPRPTLIGGNISGFAEAFQWKDFAYLGQLYSFDVYECGTAHRQYAATDAGENICLVGCGIYNNDLAYWLQDDTAEMFIYGGSTDYNTKLALIENGNLCLTDNHVEVNGGGIPSQDWCRLTGDGAAFVMQGGHLVLNNDAGAGPFAFDHLFNMVSSSSQVRLDKVKQANWLNTSEKVVTGPGAKNFRNTNSIMYNDRNNMPSRISDVSTACLCIDPTMEDTIIRDNWYISSDTATVTDKYTGTNVQIAKSTDTANGGTRSLKITKVGGVGTAAQVTLLIPANYHKRFSNQFDYRTLSAVGGSASVLYKWALDRGVSADGVPQAGNAITEFASAPLNLDGTAWRTMKGRPTQEAPAWATHLAIIIYLQDMAAGSIYIDNMWPSGW